MTQPANQPQNEHRIDYIEFPAAETAPVKQFYSSLFGWKFEDYGPGYTSFGDGRINGGFRTGDEDGRGILVVIYASELEDMRRKIENAGARITKEIFSFPGGRRFHFADPAGNELAVWSDR